MKKLLLAFCLTLFCTTVTMAQQTMTITNFEIRENPFADGQVAIVATDTAHHIQENINGVFTFAINGFDEALNFNNGTAFYRHKIGKSMFIYAKHVNDNAAPSMLYYIYDHNDKLTPLHISWIFLVGIPCGLFLIAYMFKRLIIVAIIIFIIFVYFNVHNGLSVPSFFGSVIDGLKTMF